MYEPYVIALSRRFHLDPSGLDFRKHTFRQLAAKRLESQKKVQKTASRGKSAKDISN